jgi:hypothetical protein
VRIGKTDKWQERKKKNGSEKVCSRKERMAGNIKRKLRSRQEIPPEIKRL